MSYTTNVMKDARSGIQKLIKNKCSNILDVGCICHLADLTVKTGLKELPVVDTDKLSIDVFYYFIIVVAKGNKSSVTLGAPSLFLKNPRLYFKHCPTHWLSLLSCVGHYISQYDGLFFHVMKLKPVK